MASLVSLLRRAGMALAILFTALSGQGQAQVQQVGGLGFEGQGADLVVMDLNGNDRPDMILMAYDNPAGDNAFRYRVVLDLDASGAATTHWPFLPIEIEGFGPEAQGAGAAMASLDNDPRPELILMAYDKQPTGSSFRYRIGWNLDSLGRSHAWTEHDGIAGVGEEAQGAAVVVGQIDSDPRPDMIFIAYDNPPGFNRFRYRIGFNVDGVGEASWAPDFVQVTGLGSEGQGIGAALADLDSNQRPDLVLMANDHSVLANTFRFREGRNLDLKGIASWQPSATAVAGFAVQAQGAGLAITCLDSDPRADWIVMAYDNPPQMNVFRYSVLLNRSPAPCPAFRPPMRKSIDQLTAQELESLRRGVRQMKLWNSAPRNSAEFRRSWIFWSHIHAHYGASCLNNVNFPSLPGLGGVAPAAPVNKFEQDTWCTCVHGTGNFLTWHRMYIYYFERVLQAAAGDPALRLPYWDYSASGSLPAAVRNPSYTNPLGQTVVNPLWVQQRLPGLNANTNTIAADQRSAALAMSITNFPQFSEGLEKTPHGTIHCSMTTVHCDSGYMGLPETAALDPVFYLHHSNIDRLYECWLRVSPGRRTPSAPAILATAFSFIDGDGSLVTRKVGELLTTVQLGYAYTAGGDCPAVPPSTPASDVEPPAPKVLRLAQVAGPVQLQRGVTVVPLQLTPELRAQLSSWLTSGARAHLLIDRLTFQQRPRVTYNLFLRGPAGARTLIGMVEFFSRRSADQGDHEGHGGGEIRFDATVALKNLAGTGFAQAALVLEPTTGLTDSTPAVAGLQIPTGANVRFDALRLRIER